MTSEVQLSLSEDMAGVFNSMLLNLDNNHCIVLCIVSVWKGYYGTRLISSHAAFAGSGYNNLADGVHWMWREGSVGGGIMVE